MVRVRKSIGVDWRQSFVILITGVVVVGRAEAEPPTPPVKPNTKAVKDPSPIAPQVVPQLAQHPAQEAHPAM